MQPTEALNELDIARKIAAGELPSPQQHQNVWLFALRISGTGISYRPKHHEYVLRKPEGYLTPDFLARCNGLPILWQHPPTDILTSDEFSKRIIGTMFLPYIRGDEVWGIAKIYNDEAAQRMQDEQLSTSPGVLATVLLKGTIEIDNGESTLIVEGAPALADHLAVITGSGVWDKGGPLQGVRADEAKGTEMADEKQGELLDKVLAGIDSLRTDMTKRMDNLETKMAGSDDEKKKADAKRRADAHKFSTRKDDDDDESYRKRHDTEENELKGTLVEAGQAEQLAADSAHRARKDAEDGERDGRKPIYQDSKMWESAMADAQGRADEAYQAFGKQAPPPLAGEALKAYERRLLAPLLKYSPRWKDVDLTKVSTDSTAFGVVKDQVYQDARADAGRSDLPDGELRMVERRHPVTKLPIYEFVSFGGTFIGAMKPHAIVARLNRKPDPNSR